MQAGFAAPDVELEGRLSGIAATAGGVKDFLMKAKPYASPDFHAALVEALTVCGFEGWLFQGWLFSGWSFQGRQGCFRGSVWGFDVGGLPEGRRA